jgi:predicted RNase H-like HicB family nuclease
MSKKTRNTITSVIAQYECTFRPEPEGAYTVRCAAFPEIVTLGSSLEEARRNAQEALRLCIEVYEKNGWELPASDADPRTTIKELVPVKRARA